MPDSKIIKINFNNTNVSFIILSITELIKTHLNIIDLNKSFKTPAIRVNDSQFINENFHESEIIVINNFKIFKRQIEWIAGRYAVKTIFKLAFNNDMDSKNIIAHNKVSRAPYLINHPEYKISISHSNDFAMAAITFAKNKYIGVDIEKIRGEKSLAFKKIAFTDKEIEYFKKRDLKQFYFSWSIKEAYLKYTEKGFSENLKDIEVFDNKIFIREAELKDINIFASGFEDDYVYAIVNN